MGPHRVVWIFNFDKYKCKWFFMTLGYQKLTLLKLNVGMAFDSSSAKPKAKIATKISRHEELRC